MNLDKLLKPKFSNYETVNANSKPNHDGWFIDSYWECIDWINWHKAMVIAFGKDKADEIWVKEYDKSSWGAHEISCSTNNAEFKAYVKKQELDKKSSILTRVYRAEKAINIITDPVKAAAEAGSRTAKILAWAIPITVALAGIGLITFGYLKYIKPNLKKAA